MNKTAMTLMPKCLLIILLLSSLYAIAQTKDDNTVEVPLFYEKAFIHTDREVYLQGEDIWFKAYLVNAQDNKPINYSHILYVELITPSAKVYARHFVRMDNGLGNGDFKLADTLAAGTYRIRAYTNWMRNFGDHFIFEKQIRIINNADKIAPAIATIPAKKKKGKTEAIAAAPDTLPVVRFFPEGGAMVSGITSVIAVKAEDAYGRGLPATGEVINNTGQTITRFTCDSLGFGSFTLLPDATQHYQAQVSIYGQKTRFVMPDVKAGGIGFSIKTVKGNMQAVLNCSAAEFSKHEGERFTLTGKHAGKVIFNQRIEITEQANPFDIPTDLFPDGIAILTVTDDQAQPLAERLVYVNHPEHTRLMVSSDKLSYAPKEPVAVKIKLSQSERASLSLAAVDAGTSPVSAENILSYLNLQSEVKGTIEQPARYFDTTNVNRFNQLDLLLLTQGWRGFVWKKLQDTTLNFSYEPEQGITITGKVRRVGSKSPLPNINITMRAPQAKQEKLFWALSDSAGRFSFYNPMIYGYQLISFTARRSDKINRDGQSKGASAGWLQVDSLFQNQLPVAALQFPPADTLLKSNEDVNSTIARLRRNLNLAADRNLKEVKIKANTSRLVTVLPPEIHNITLLEQKEYNNLAEYLLYNVEGAHLSFGICNWCTTPSGSDPNYLTSYLSDIKKGKIPIYGVYADHSKLDNCYICQDQYLVLPMSNVLKVTINKSMSVFGLSTSVSLVLRPGVMEPKDYFDNTVANMIGYYKARIFYTPKTDARGELPDTRSNTIHWEPNIITDANGEALVNYYNTSLPGKVRLVVQGVTDMGTPVVSTINYEVK